MKVNVRIFGQLTEITGTDFLAFQDIPDTGLLIDHLKELFPALEHARFACAVDRKVITENTPLRENCDVALLPPFSGG